MNEVNNNSSGSSSSSSLLSGIEIPQPMAIAPQQVVEEGGIPADQLSKSGKRKRGQGKNVTE